MENIAADSTKPKKPLYRRSKFYIYLIFGVILAIFITLTISVLILRWVNPPTTSFILQQNWESLPGERYSLRESWVDFENLPIHSTWAVVASEDQLFWSHRGFDFESIQEAWEDRQEGVRSRGASSITQQVAKNIYLWPAESFLRKGIEAGITVLIETFWAKERIIEVYLNIAEFGPGVFGIGKASGQFFDIPASELEPDMSARLVAVLPNPKRMRVSPPSPYTEERRSWILSQMTRLSGIAYIKVDSTTVNDPNPAKKEDSSALTDSLLKTQPVNSVSFTPDSLISEPPADAPSPNDTSASDSLADSIPSF